MRYWQTSLFLNEEIKKSTSKDSDAAGDLCVFVLHGRPHRKKEE